MTNDIYYFMKEAIKKAKKTKIDIPIACIIVDEKNNIIASACNKKELKKDPTQHAELIAIKKACKKIDNWRLDNCTMYVTLEPCPMCSWAIINSRISNLYFGSYDSLYGALGTKIDLRKIANSKLNVKGGIMEDECNKILKDYFKKMRQNEG